MKVSYRVVGLRPSQSFYYCARQYRQADILVCDPDSDPPDQVRALQFNVDSLLARGVVEPLPAEAPPKKQPARPDAEKE